METGAAPHKLCGWNPAQNEGPTVVRHAGRERSKETERESPVTGRATAMVDSIASHVIRCQGLMFFASGFDRVAEGGSYEIHYEARNKMGKSYSNADCKKFDVFQWCLPWCLSCLLCCSGFLQHLRARQKSCGLLLVSSFASCGCMSLATPCVLLSAVSCIVFGDVPSMHTKIDVFMFTSQRMTKCKDVTAAVSLVF